MKKKLYDAVELMRIASIVEIATHLGYNVVRKKKEYCIFCPEHADHSNPNCMLNEEKNIFHCFACGFSGNIFTLVQKTLNINFLEALEYIAELYGLKKEKKIKKHYTLPLNSFLEELGIKNKPTFELIKIIQNEAEANTFENKGYIVKKIYQDYIIERIIYNNPLRHLMITNKSLYKEIIRNKYSEKISIYNQMIKSWQTNTNEYNSDFEKICKEKISWLQECFLQYVV